MPTASVPQPTQEQLLAVAERVRAAFPHAVNGADLVLIDVDPRHLHAFWTVPFAEAEQVLNRIGGKADSAPMVLRVCPVADDGNALAEAFDIEVLGLQGQFYVDIWDTARRYRATLGYRLADGTLVALAASEVAELPPLGPTEDHTWREIALPPPATPVLTTIAAAPPVPAASPTAVTAAAATSPPIPALPSRIAAMPPPAPSPAMNVPPVTPIPTVSAAPAVTGGPAAATAAAVGEPPRVAEAGKEAAASSDTSLAERVAALSPKSPAQGASMTAASAADSRYGTPVPDASDATPRSVSSAPLGLAPAAPVPPSAPAPSPPVTGDRAHPAPFPTSPFGQVDEHRPLDGSGAPLRFWEMPPVGDSPAAPSMPSADAPAVEPGSPEPAPPAPEDAGGQGPVGQEGPAALPLPPENVLSLSSFLFGSSDPVELEVNAELHVFGRVKPGSRLLLFGRPVSIRPDGTFSIHRPLGTGAAIMPVLLTEEDDAEKMPEDRGEPASGETE